MPTKIRLSRHGKTHKAFYHIVVADGRAPRDGRFIEKIGTYNPIANPAEIVLDFDRALDWIQKGAQPTDTARAILSYKGVLYKNHLLNGAKKGAFSEAEAEAKFQKWMEEKDAKISAKKSGIDEKERSELKARFDAEAKVNEERAAELAKKKAAEVEAKVKAAQAKAAEAKKDEPEAEVKEEVAEVKEEAAEVKEEVTEVKEEKAAEVEDKKADAPVEEAENKNETAEPADEETKKEE